MFNHKWFWVGKVELDLEKLVKIIFPRALVALPSEESQHDFQNNT